MGTASISDTRHRFPPAVILHAIWQSLLFSLSYRDNKNLLAERGLDISCKTIRRWVAKFGPLFEKEQWPRSGGAYAIHETK